MRLLAIASTALVLSAASAGMSGPAWAIYDGCNFVDYYFIEPGDTSRGDVNQNMKDSNAPYNNIKQLLEVRDFATNNNLKDLRECVRNRLKENSTPTNTRMP